MEAGLTGTLQQIIREVVSMYGASRLLVAVAGDSQPAKISGRVAQRQRRTLRFRWLESGPRDAKTYLEDFPGEVCYAAITTEIAGRCSHWIDEGNQVPSPSTEALVRIEASGSPSAR